MLIAPGMWPGSYWRAAGRESMSMTPLIGGMSTSGRSAVELDQLAVPAVLGLHCRRIGGQRISRPGEKLRRTQSGQNRREQRKTFCFHDDLL